MKKSKRLKHIVAEHAKLQRIFRGHFVPEERAIFATRKTIRGAFPHLTAHKDAADLELIKNQARAAGVTDER